MKHPLAPARSIFQSVCFWVWIPLLGLGILLIYGLISLPPLGEVNPTFHVASRYIDRGPSEAALSFPFLSVLLDYRSFDLMLLGVFFLALGLIALVFAVVENVAVRFKEWRWLWVVFLSSLGLWIIGGVGLKDGSNFMDYEFWAGLFGSFARTGGAILTGGFVFILVIASFVWAGKILKLGKRGSSWR